ncbi:MAG TPA: DnaJ domain-containing protein [Thermodesulfobacteriota bacterium]|nr:DnaJ domain-containing protein [Thermodesulfobacteriota bacterium]
MGSSRALIVGSDKDYCYVIKEFLDSRGMICSLILDYNQGIDKLFYENPDITVIELISSHKVSSNLIGKVRNSIELQIIDFTHDSNVEVDKESKPVFFLEETSQLNTLLAFLNTYFLTNSGSEQTSAKSQEPVSNDIELFPYPILLSYLYKNSLSGILTINSNVNLKLYFEDGVAVYAEGGDVETALGRMLLESGRISDVKDYEKALNIATEKKQKLGEVLVSMGVLSPHELNELLENQIQEKVIRGFLLKSGAFNFESGKSKISNIVKYDIDFPKVLYQGTKRYGNQQFIKNIFFNSGEANNIKVIKDLSQKTGGLGLGPKELRIIQNLEQNTNIENLLNKTTTTNDETLKILFLIYLLGYVVVENDDYRNIGRLFNQASDDPYAGSNEEEFEDIIDLDEEIAESAKAESTKTEVKKELSEKDKEIINTVSKMELEMEIDSPTSTSTSNVIPFKEQAKNPVEEKINIKGPEPPSKEKDNSGLVKSISDLYDRLDEEDHYMILGVDKDSTKQQIRDSYYALVKKYHPDILAKLDDSTRDKADKIFSVITTAYQTLSDDEKREEYDSVSELDDLKSEAQILYQAEVSFNEGAALLKQKKYALAEEKFNNAIQINPDNILYKGIIYWGRFLNNKDDSVNTDECVKELEKLISLDPNVAENYFYLGNIYKHIDEFKKAENNFSKAVENDPDYTEAKRELRVLQNRLSEKKEARKSKTEKRFWSSLFKK